MITPCCCGPDHVSVETVRVDHPQPQPGTGQVSEDFGRPSAEAPPVGATRDKSGAGDRPWAARLHDLAAPEKQKKGSCGTISTRRGQNDAKFMTS